MYAQQRDTHSHRECGSNGFVKYMPAKCWIRISPVCIYFLPAIATLVNDDNPIKNSGAHPVSVHVDLYSFICPVTSNNIHAAERPGASLTMSVFDAARAEWNG
jgi:hypothetical protein